MTSSLIFLPRQKAGASAHARGLELLQNALHYRRAAEGLFPEQHDQATRAKVGLHYLVFTAEWSPQRGYVRRERIPLTRDLLHQEVVEQAVRRDLDVTLRTQSGELSFLQAKVREQEQVILSVLTFLRETAAQEVLPEWPVLNWGTVALPTEAPTLEHFIKLSQLEETIHNIESLVVDFFGKSARTQFRLRKDRESSEYELVAEIRYNPAETSRDAHKSFIERYSETIPAEHQTKIALLRLPG